MSRHRTSVILGVLALLPGGCRETVWLDLRVVRQSASTAVEQVRVAVYSPPSAGRSSLPDALRSLGTRLDLRLVSEVPSAPLRVTVDGYRATDPSAPVLRQEYLITLPNRGGGALQVVLWDACVGRGPCPPSQTCGSDGTCVPMQVTEVPASDVGWVAPERCGALTCAGFRDAGAGDGRRARRLPRRRRGHAHGAPHRRGRRRAGGQRCETAGGVPGAERHRGAGVDRVQRCVVPHGV